MKKEPLQFLTPLIAVISVILLIGIGRGISGGYIIAFFLFLVLSTWLASFYKRRVAKQKGLESNVRFLKFGFEAEAILLVGSLILWITLLDFFIVETFKVLNYSFVDNTYWVILFGGIVPIVVIAVALAYYIGSQNMANTIRVVVLSIFFFHSNIIDVLYYRLFNEKFPDVWTWLYQPRFLFGADIVTWQLAVWCIIALIMGVIAFILPYENFTPAKLDLKYDTVLPKYNKRMNIIFMSIFALFAIVYSSFMIIQIKDSIKNYLTDKYGNHAEDKDRAITTADFDVDVPVKTAETVVARFETAHKAIDSLNAQFQKEGAYPKSTGTCEKDWDSSLKDLPFTVDGQQVEDPVQSHGEICQVTADAHNVWYYSDGTKFALILSGENVPSEKGDHLYIAGKRDVQWFTQDVKFFQDWKWNPGIPYLVFMFDKGNEVTFFQK